MEFEAKSFIPQSTFTGGQGGRKTFYREAGAGFMIKFSSAILFISLAGFGGALFYQKDMTKQIDAYTDPLERAKAAVDTSFITDAQNLSEKLSVASQLITKHRILSRVFRLLEDMTFEDIRFSNFTYDSLSNAQSASNAPSVKLTGEAKNFTALAKQTEIFKKNSDIIDASFSRFLLNEKGYVGFSLVLTLKPEIFIYD